MAQREYRDGIPFTLDRRRGYFYNTTLRKYLHQYIWEKTNGPIPRGMAVHHRDGDKANNVLENYELLTGSARSLHHWQADREEMLAHCRESIEVARLAMWMRLWSRRR